MDYNTKSKVIASMLAWMCTIVTVAPATAQETITLDVLFHLVEDNNNQLQSDRMEVETAAQGVRTAESQRLPEVNAKLSASLNGDALIMDRNFSNVQSFTSPRCGNSFDIEFQQPLYTGGAINAGIELAKLGRQMEEVNLSASRNRLRFKVLSQYLELIKLDHALRIYDQNIALTRRLIDNLQAMRNEGMALRNDLTRSELQLQELSLGRRKVEDARKVVNHQLCNAAGIDDVRIVPDTAIVDMQFAQDNETHWQELSLSESSDIARQNVRVRMAQEELKLSKSCKLPKIALVAADNLTGPYNYDIPPIDKNVNIWYLGVGVKYSLSNIWKSSSNIRKAKSALQQSQLQQLVVNEEINNEIQEAYTQYMQSYAELATQQKSVELATLNYEVVNERYLNQLALITDMIDASNIRLVAELREADARVNIAFAYHKLKFISGTL